MEISNKTLAWFVIGAVVVSLAGSIFSLTNSNGITGYVTSNTTGNLSVDVSQSIILRFAINSTDFGSGSVDSGAFYNNCTLAIDANATIYKTGCIGFNTVNSGGNGPFVLENAGTSNLNVTLNFTGNASTFIGGNVTVSSLRFRVSENATGSCAAGVITHNTWTEVGAINTLTSACTNLSWNPGANTIKVGLNITIPTDAISGSRSIIVLAQGTNI